MISDENSIEPVKSVETGGKDPTTGRFLPGNSAAKKGISHKMTQLRSAVLNAVKESDVLDVLNAMIAKAKDGDCKAAQLVFEVTGIRVKTVEATIEEGAQKSYIAIAVESV